MIEVSLTLYTLLIEALVICVVVIMVSTAVVLKKRKRDRSAAGKLVKQIKHQSQTRLEQTGSFLSEKYRFEGNELKKAVNAIDKSEKVFFQHIINVYLKRDASGLEAMDASVAEMIDTYKSLTPIMPDAASPPAADSESIEEIARLEEANAKLSEELMITKETMSNMISEFGNMFGGGKDHELAKHEVVEKVHVNQPKTPDADISEGMDDIELETSEINDVNDSIDPESAMDQESDGQSEDQSGVDAILKEQQAEEVVDDDEVDELLNSIDLSENK